MPIIKCNFIKKWLAPNLIPGTYLIIGGILFLIFIFLFFNIMGAVIGQSRPMQSDLKIIIFLQTFRTPFLNNIMMLATDLGEWQIAALVIAVAGIIFALLKKWHYLLVLFISFSGGESLVWLMKNIIKRSRPDLLSALVAETGFSFPSNHSFIAISLYGLLGYFIFRAIKNKPLKILSALLTFFVVLAIGFSRIYLGVHWPSDVWAGYALAAAWLTVLIMVFEIKENKPPRFLK